MPAYVPRIIEKQIQNAAKEFPVVVLTGPRQTGKSTLLKKILPNCDYVALDDPLTVAAVRKDPRFFLSRSPRMIIDEIQQLPEILPFIKMAVDQKRDKNGVYFLTGSQIFPLMAGISESLAGRAALYELLGFSLKEVKEPQADHPNRCFELIFSGFYPQVLAHHADRNRFFSSYFQTYLERDIRQITSVHDLKVFQNFLELIAARVGGLLNLNEIAKECAISFSSARRWLSLLETTRIVYLLRPWVRNVTKRIVKSPKIYFTDTGLLAYLLRYPDAKVLQAGPQAGAFFENLIVVELLKHKWNNNLNYELFFYRDSNHNEVDLVIDCGPKKMLCEIKTTMTPAPGHFLILQKIAAQIPGSGGYLLSFTNKREKFSANLMSLPWQEIFEYI